MNETEIGSALAKMSGWDVVYDVDNMNAKFSTQKSETILRELYQKKPTIVFTSEEDEFEGYYNCSLYNEGGILFIKKEYHPTQAGHVYENTQLLMWKG